MRIKRILAVPILAAFLLLCGCAGEPPQAPDVEDPELAQALRELAEQFGNRVVSRTLEGWSTANRGITP